MADTDIAALLDAFGPRLRAALDSRVVLVLEVAADCPAAAADGLELEEAFICAVRQLLGSILESGRLMLGAHADADGTIVLTVATGDGQRIIQRVPQVAAAPTPAGY